MYFYELHSNAHRQHEQSINPATQQYELFGGTNHNFPEEGAHTIIFSHIWTNAMTKKSELYLYARLTKSHGTRPGEAPNARTTINQLALQSIGHLAS